MRGYNDKTYEYPKYSIISCGLNYTPSSNLQFEVFSDLGSSSLYFNSKNWFGYGLEYNFNFNFNAYFNSIVNYENEIAGKPTYSNFGVSYSKNANKLILSYGKQRGG